MAIQPIEKEVEEYNLPGRYADMVLAEHDAGEAVGNGNELAIRCKVGDLVFVWASGGTVNFKVEAGLTPKQKEFGVTPTSGAASTTSLLDGTIEAIRVTESHLQKGGTFGNHILIEVDGTAGWARVLGVIR